ncbi:hypothetical protein [Streptosporangium sp. NPDC002524]|uniref:hypothetical protein n=1 Tax=Streptosporangium sp. NPDC002524 TaxID=3154537 RepID=UPI00332C86C6
MRAAYLLTGDARLAEDLLRSVLIKVVGQWPKLSEGGNPEAYVRKAPVNQYISWWRRPRPESPSADPPERGASCDEAALDRIVLRQAPAGTVTITRWNSHRGAVVSAYCPPAVHAVERRPESG